MPFTDGSYPGFGLSPGAFPLVHSGGDTNNVKLNHDAYDVYVNADYVGKKVLLVQGEHIGDVDSFLHSRGFSGFTSRLDGDHYEIEVDPDLQQAVRDNLHMYLDIR
ncbi:hypothetical protein [Ectobacillus ponti]|uniref:Uncharacterized protein n=1 Tax=Ectobacillus ponti TaxID=2961894 RepID=A0AA42BT67_9BACI|nr:hypothetical protein [Ectobacillus ponti]MCP8969163.1 hypothetical protein [Ectobacillus ponti]